MQWNGLCFPRRIRASILGATLLFYTMIGSLYFYTNQQTIARITELKQIQSAYLQSFDNLKVTK